MRPLVTEARYTIAERTTVAEKRMSPIKVVPISINRCGSNVPYIELIPVSLSVSPLLPALAHAVLPFLNKFPDACFCLTFALALMHAFAIATASTVPSVAVNGIARSRNSLADLQANFIVARQHDAQIYRVGR